MAHQSLDNSEVLNVRWATADPNPQAQKREARAIEEQAAEAIRRALPAEYVAEIEGRSEEAKKRRRIEGAFGLQGYSAPDDVWYAAEKARVAGARQDGAEMLEGIQERRLIEGHADQRNGEAMDAGGGLLSASTLAALKNYSASPAPNIAKASDASAGPLVAYGSDDESE